MVRFPLPVYKHCWIAVCWMYTYPGKRIHKWGVRCALIIFLPVAIWQRPYKKHPGWFNRNSKTTLIIILCLQIFLAFISIYNWFQNPLSQRHLRRDCPYLLATFTSSFSQTTRKPTSHTGCQYW